MTFSSKAVTALFLAGAVACSSSSSGTSSGSDPSASGDDCRTGKNAAWAMPAGTAFALPAGITLDGDMTGDTEANCGQNHFEEYGGDDLPICIGLKNAGTADVKVTFPAGLTFISKDPTSQNGIILQSHDLTATAGQTTYFLFRLFCINEHCIYGRKQDRYVFGNVSNDTKMAELIALAAGKKLVNGSDISAALFFGVWDITDGDGLTDEHRLAIQHAS